MTPNFYNTSMQHLDIEDTNVWRIMISHAAIPLATLNEPVFVSSRSPPQL